MVLWLLLKYVGVLKTTTQIHSGDRVVLYGLAEAIHRLDDRVAGSVGEQEHCKVLAQQHLEIEGQDQREAAASQFDTTQQPFCRRIRT
jgi:hypothetical protein